MTITPISDVPLDTVAVLLQMKPGLEELRHKISAPHQPTGFWYLDLDLAEKHCVVTWQIGRGYGLCFKFEDSDMGNAPDEVVEDIHLAVDKIYDFFLR